MKNKVTEKQATSQERWEEVRAKCQEE